MDFELLIYVGAAVFIVVILLFQKRNYYRLNDEIKDEKLTTLDGNKINISDIVGKPIFIEFMNSWCDDCQEVYPFINILEKKYSGKIKFFSIIRGNEKDENIKKYFMDFPPVGEVIADHKRKFYNKFFQKGIPSFIVFDSSHKLVYKSNGWNKEELQKIDSILKYVSRD